MLRGCLAYGSTLSLLTTASVASACGLCSRRLVTLPGRAARVDAILRRWRSTCSMLPSARVASACLWPLQPLPRRLAAAVTHGSTRSLMQHLRPSPCFRHAACADVMLCRWHSTVDSAACLGACGLGCDLGDRCPSPRRRSAACADVTLRRCRSTLATAVCLCALSGIFRPHTLPQPVASV